jgi:plasmid stability protein
MATLHVRNVPDDLYRRIQEKAEADRRSVSGEIIVLLERGLRSAEGPRRAMVEALERMAARQQGLAPPPDWPGVVALLREDRDR